MFLWMRLLEPNHRVEPNYLMCVSLPTADYSVNQYAKHKNERDSESTFGPIDARVTYSFSLGFIEILYLHTEAHNSTLIQMDEHKVLPSGHDTLINNKQMKTHEMKCSELTPKKAQSRKWC